MRLQMKVFGKKGANEKRERDEGCARTSESGAFTSRGETGKKTTV